MKTENRLALERSLGVIQGVACSLDDSMSAVLFDALEIIDAILDDEEGCVQSEVCCGEQRAEKETAF
jgi:hypothetical protein